MKTLMLSTDRNIFKIGSHVRERMVDYGSICDELHIIVLTLKVYTPQVISDNVFVYPTNSFFKIFYLSDAINISRKISGINLVTAQDPFETGFIGWCIAKIIVAKLQLQIHTDFLSPYFIKNSSLNKIRVLLAKFLLPKADNIRVVSERIKKSLQTINYKLMAEPRILPIFVDAQKIMSGIPKFDLHKKYPQFNFIILTVARLEPEKNIDLSLLVMKDLIKEYPNVGLILVGDGSEKEKLKEKIVKLKLEKNVIFEGWQDDTISYYKGADLYLCASNYEGYGMSLIEVVLSGCPIVTTDVGEANYTLKNGAGALVCPVGDNMCIKGNIAKILINPELGKRLSRTALAEVLANIPNEKKEYLLKYKKLLSN